MTIALARGGPKGPPRILAADPKRTVKLRVVGHSSPTASLLVFVGLSPSRGHLETLSLREPDTRREVIDKKGEVQLAATARDDGLTPFAQRAQKCTSAAYLL